MRRKMFTFEIIPFCFERAARIAKSSTVPRPLGIRQTKQFGQIFYVNTVARLREFVVVRQVAPLCDVMLAELRLRGDCV